MKFLNTSGFLLARAVLLCEALFDPTRRYFIARVGRTWVDGDDAVFLEGLFDRCCNYRRLGDRACVRCVLHLSWCAPSEGKYGWSITLGLQF